MKCFKERTLSAYLNDELNRNTIGVSPKRADCPSEETIGAYADHLLDIGESSIVEEHLSNCHSCLRKFVLAREMTFIKSGEIAGEVPANLIEKAQKLVGGKLAPIKSKLFELTLALRGAAMDIVKTTVDTVQLLGSGQGMMEPVTVRDAMSRIKTDGQIKGIIIHHKQGEIDFLFEVVNMGQERCRLRLTLQDIHAHTPKAGLRINLCDGKRILQSQPTDRQGDVIMENVPVGNYLVRVTDAKEYEMPLSLIKGNVKL